MKQFVILIFSLFITACDSYDNNESNNSQNSQTIDKTIIDEPAVDKSIVDNNAAANEPTIADDKSVISDTIPVVGTWSQMIPSVNCIETFSFNSDDTFSGTSLNESLSGTYTFTSLSNTESNSQSNSSSRHPFSFKVTNDNQQSDCEGDSTNDTGSAFEIFVEFPNETVMNWYLHSSDDSPVVTLNKQ